MYILCQLNYETVTILYRYKIEAQVIGTVTNNFIIKNVC